MQWLDPAHWVIRGCQTFSAETIRAAYDGHHDLEAMGRRGREYDVREADRHVAVGRYRELLREIVAY